MAGFVLGIKGTKLNCKNFVLEAVCDGALGGRGWQYILEIFFFCLELSIMLYSFVYKKKKNPPN